jgi:hypothetical protein
MKPVKVKGRVSQKDLTSTIDFSKSVTINKELLFTMMVEQRRRFKFNIDLWLTLLARYLPSRCKSSQSNRVLKLASRSMSRIQKTRDVKNIVRQHDDV